MALPFRRIGTTIRTTTASTAPAVHRLTSLRTAPLPRYATTGLPPRRAMVSSTESAPREYEWLVVVPDFPGALAKRLEARPHHFAALKPFIDSGRYQMGGAILDEVPADDEPSSLKMSGSTLVVVAASKEEILNTLREDIYAKSGVWDVDKAQMWPLKCAFRVPVKQ